MGSGSVSVYIRTFPSLKPPGLLSTQTQGIPHPFFLKYTYTDTQPNETHAPDPPPRRHRPPVPATAGGRRPQGLWRPRLLPPLPLWRWWKGRGRVLLRWWGCCWMGCCLSLGPGPPRSRLMLVPAPAPQALRVLLLVVFLPVMAPSCLPAVWWWGIRNRQTRFRRLRSIDRLIDHTMDHTPQARRRQGMHRGACRAACPSRVDLESASVHAPLLFLLLTVASGEGRLARQGVMTRSNPFRL